MPDMGFDDWLTTTRTLQIKSYGKDPWYLEGDERAEYIRWNVLAATDELHEALGEVGWKPWATSRHLNREQFVSEIVDVMHFCANLLVTARCTGSELSTVYRTKQEKNRKRMSDGYDGLTGKCPVCKRDLGELPPDHDCEDGT